MAAESPETLPLDTDDTRGLHFKNLLGNAVFLSITTTLAIVAVIVGVTQGSIAIGGGAAAAVVILGLLVVFLIAAGRAKEDFFNAYATQRGLNRQGKGMLPPSTPLLRKGDRRYAEQIMNGTLPGGLPGAIALYTYEERHRDSDGNEDVDRYRFTVCMHDLPAVAHHVSDIYCQRRSGFRFMDSAEDVFRRMKRLELESEALDKKYEIFYGANDDEVWVKRLFSPQFIVWLSEDVPDGLAFELSAGSLCVNRKGHHKSAPDFDHLAESSGQIARRLAGEAEQTNLPR
jgi:hypothetical protein